MDERNDDVRARIESVCRVLEERLREDPPMEELAEAASFSPFHFHRLFRGFTGETVRGYTRRLRLERAAHRLEHTDEEILGIALDSGYGSHESFTRAFGKHFGTPPSDYRESARSTSTTPPPTGTEPVQVRIEERRPCTVACVRHVGPYAEVGDAWRSLMKWGWSKMLFGSPSTFGLCYDDPDVTKPERLRYEACMVVPAGTRTKRDVELRELTGGYFALATHAGTYANIGLTYAALFTHVASRSVGNRRWRLGDPPSIEIYQNDPRKTRPEELLTELWMPVRPS